MKCIRRMSLKKEKLKSENSLMMFTFFFLSLRLSGYYDVIPFAKQKPQECSGANALSNTGYTVKDSPSGHFHNEVERTKNIPLAFPLLDLPPILQMATFLS